MSIENRRAKRVEVNVDTKLSDENETITTGKILDISTGGVKIKTENDIKQFLGKKLSLNFVLKKLKYLKTGKEINVKVEIVREYGNNTYGCKFIDIDLLSKQRIRDYIEFKLRGSIL